MAQTKNVAVYPGTFDPITFGHIDIIKRARELFDEVYVAVANPADKVPLFNMQERVQFAKKATANLKDVNVESFDGLVVDFAKQKHSKVIIRGIRATSDFDYEFQMALSNRELNSQVQTIFLVPSVAHFYISSRLIKEIAHLGGRIDMFVPSFVERKLRERIQRV